MSWSIKRFEFPEDLQLLSARFFKQISIQSAVDLEHVGLISCVLSIQSYIYTRWRSNDSDQLFVTTSNVGVKTKLSK